MINKTRHNNANTNVAQPPMGIMAPSADDMRAALKSTIAQHKLSTLDRQKPADLKLIKAFEALPQDARYDISNKNESDRARSAGVLADDTIVVKEIGFSGIPSYQKAGKFQVRW
jgi:hypothetical protein